MNLSMKPEIKVWPVSYYIFVEKVGHFMETAPQAWRELHQLLSQIKDANFNSFAAFYKMKPEMVYRAGVCVPEPPASLPAGLRHEKFVGGKYSAYTLTGSYSQLPEACGRVFEEIKKGQISVRDDWFIEHYVNDPKSTPESELKTEIMIPTN